MNFLNLVLISAALAMDAMAVALATGAKHVRAPHKKALKMALFFGLFQGLMPVLGWQLGKSFITFISNFDHWVAFAILAGIGIKMIITALVNTHDPKILQEELIIELILLSVATSIDALAVGLSLAFVKADILFSALVIAVITFILSWVSVYAGYKFGKVLGRKVEIVGGLVLVFIGIQILVKHLY